MCHPAIALLAAVLISAGAAAQSVPPASASQTRWDAAPARAGSTPRTPVAAEAKPSPFKFKDDRPRLDRADQLPPSANDKAAVMGTVRPWQDGKPPADCAVHPHDASCH